ncbi:MAG TPA: lactate racemase domain-containing protein [Streptosporangiaceae bacterium]|nr:lactate racemase domain-containing protein [Streptosporangiaceae bacterium]
MLAGLIQRDIPPIELLRVRRTQRPAVEPLDAGAAVSAALQPLLASLRPGARIALGVGSRGIAGLAEVVTACVATLRAAGAQPFIVPAMGSHGGATGQGQEHILRELGVTQQTVGAPVMASMDTVCVGSLEPGLDVFIDRHAWAADAIFVINRVKSHTSFTGVIESGLAKMLAIGLGKQRGAEELHRLGPLHLEHRIRRVARHLVDNLPVLGGLALVEDGAKNLRLVQYVAPKDIGETGEAALLSQAKQLEARLPVSLIDVLIVDAIGKDRSGTGMDTNVIGRRMVRGSPEPTHPVITNVVALSLTAGSGGNAIGLGLADFVPQRLMADVDLTATYANALTAGLQGVQRAQIPITLATDRDAVAAAILTAGTVDPSQARVVRIRDTLRLEELMVTRSLLDECEHAGYTPAPQPAGPAPLFDPDGRITRW